MRIGMIALLCLFCATPASAWEADVHYGLTKWLALQAGFTAEDAEWIAMGDVGSDSGVLDATHLVPWYTCFGRRDVQASMLTRDRHFPTLGRVPAPPDERRVLPGGPAATAPVYEIAEAMRGQAPSPLEREWILRRFGATLHALQDSWSHQGVPDPPAVACNQDLAWAHPRDRDGWLSHTADLTPKWDNDTLFMATATYRALTTFRDKSPGWPASLWGAPTPARWEALEPRVVTFQKSTTKAWKQKWFRCEGFSSFEFLSKINLPDGTPRPDPDCGPLTASAVPAPLPTARTFQVPAPSAAPTPSPQTGTAPPVVPTDLKQFLDAFLAAWMVERDADGKLLNEFVNPAAVASTMAIAAGLAAIAPGDERRVALASLSMWRIRDHGLVEQLGHGRLGSLLNTVGAIGQDWSFRITYKSLEEVTYPIAGCSDHFIVIEHSKNDITAITRFKHAPEDTVVIKVTRDPKTTRWRVQSIGWMVEHE